MFNPNAAQSDFAVYIITEAAEGITGFWLYILQKGNNVVAHPDYSTPQIVSFELEERFEEEKEEIQHVKDTAEWLYYV
jgi:hypothetical protein